MKRWKRRKLPTAICLAAIPMLVTAPATWAIDAYLPMFTNYYPNTAGTALDDCVVCHTTSAGGGRNSYGLDFELVKVTNDVTGVENALFAIEPLDSDGDGVINIDEILNLTFPGGDTGGEIPPGTITEGPTEMACYRWDKFPNERFALSIKRYGGLVTEEPRNDFIESQLQTNHGVHGKHVGVCWPNTIGLADGAFLKAKGVGSHLALHSMTGRGDGELGGEDWCRSIVIDCISEEDVQVPKEFKCRSRNEFDLFHGKSQLKLVENPAEDPLCNAFEATGEISAPGGVRASGLDFQQGERDDD
jgi:hypothetical protein